VLLFTPDIQELLEWFYAIHELRPHMGGLRWERIGLPMPGGIGEQDARLLDSLDFLRQLFNSILLMRARKQSKRPASTTNG
jgi:hypothetical protein